MPVLVLSILKAITIDWIGKLLSRAFLEWFMLWAAEHLVKSTETPHDDEFFNHVKKAIENERSPKVGP